MKQLVVAESADKIMQRILEVKSGRPVVSIKTCWNQVGLYLKSHPTTRGQVRLFGVREMTVPYVAHAILVDDHGRVLVDGYRAYNPKTPSFYQRRDQEESYVLLKTFDVGYDS